LHFYIINQTLENLLVQNSLATAKWFCSYHLRLAMTCSPLAATEQTPNESHHWDFSKQEKFLSVMLYIAPMGAENL